MTAELREAVTQLRQRAQAWKGAAGEWREQLNFRKGEECDLLAAEDDAVAGLLDAIEDKSEYHRKTSAGGGAYFELVEDAARAIAASILGEPPAGQDRSAEQVNAEHFITVKPTRRGDWRLSCSCGHKEYANTSIEADYWGKKHVARKASR